MKWNGCNNRLHSNSSYVIFPQHSHGFINWRSTGRGNKSESKSSRGFSDFKGAERTEASKGEDSRDEFGERNLSYMLMRCSFKVMIEVAACLLHL